jgi:hypothetical protein
VSAQPGPIRQPATAASLPHRVREVYARHIGPGERALLVSWASFGATFATARVVTHRLRRRGGVGGILIRGRHIHHYNFGIALLAAVGGTAVAGHDPPRHPLLAAAYGGGAALIVDELALLLDLEDVYWAKQGRTSVDAAVGVIAVAGTFFAAAPFWADLVRELARTRRLV